MALREMPPPTPQRLKAMVSEGMGLGARVLALEPLEGDASDRRYFRLRLSGATSPTAVLMQLSSPGPELPEDLPYLSVRAYLEELGLGVPSLYAYYPRPGLLLLEDLGDLTMERALLHPGRRDEVRARFRWAYRQALELLLALQIRASPPGEGEQGRSVALRRAFDVETFVRELNYTLEHAVRGLLGLKLNEGELQQHFTRLSEAMFEGPMVFTHRDFHSRNLMLRGEELLMVDFQDARLGPRHYDLASLLYDSYVCLGEELRAELLRYYMRRWRALAGETWDGDKFLHAFRCAALQRNLKAIGTFASLRARKGTDRYLRYIPPTAAYIRQHLDLLPEMEPLARALERALRGWEGLRGVAHERVARVDL